MAIFLLKKIVMVQFRNYFTTQNEWIFSPNSSVGEISPYYQDFRSFQFKGNFIDSRLIRDLKSLEEEAESVDQALEMMTDLFLDHMLHPNDWLHSRERNLDDQAVFALNIGLLPFENSDGSRGRNLSYTFQIFRNQSIIDLVKHGRWLDDQVSGFEEINYYFAKTKDLLKIRDLQTGIAGRPSQVFDMISPFISELNNQEYLIRQIEFEKSPTYLAVNLTSDFDNWEKSGAAQLDKLNGFKVQSRISGLFDHISQRDLLDIKNRADIFKNIMKMQLEKQPRLHEQDFQLNEQQVNVPEKYRSKQSISIKRTIANALSLLDRPFVWEGNDENGFDVAGFIEYLRLISGLTNIGGKPYIQAAKLRQAGRMIKKYVYAFPGDLLFWGGQGAEYQVGLYMGGGQYIGLKGPGSKVSIQPVTGEPLAYDALF
ncbi:NlpC/P60 family protein [Oenococcus alcoholitolerans]|uniref:NlpC/P60 family protein n=1 Tax=Oenococcus alcoholitolerans TaxID=931074 RepID=UPI003F72FE1E